MKKILLKLLVGFSIIVLLGYGAIIVYFSTQENKLVFEAEYGKPPLTIPHDSLNLQLERVELVSDELKLSGWLIETNKDTSSLWILFFHGNASNISYNDYLSRYKIFSDLGFNLLTVDYRGFGESEGAPSESGLYNDAIACYNFLVGSKNIATKRIIIYGHSLGAAVAVDLATRMDAAALIVEGAFTSIPGIAKLSYPFLPIDKIVSIKFESISKIDKIKMPKLIIHSCEDEIIPFSEGKALFEKAFSPKKFLELTGGHDNAPITSKIDFNYGLITFLKENSIIK